MNDFRLRRDKGRYLPEQEVQHLARRNVYSSQSVHRTRISNEESIGKASGLSLYKRCYCPKELKIGRPLQEETKVGTPLFLKQSKGVMIVSPVSASSPMTPMRFRAEWMKEPGLVLSPYANEAKRNLRSITPGNAIRSLDREAGNNVQAAVESDALLAQQGKMVQAQVETVVNAVSSVVLNMFKKREVIEWISKSELEKAYRRFEQLCLAMNLLCNFLGINAGPSKLDDYRADQGVTLVKTAMIVLQKITERLSNTLTTRQPPAALFSKIQTTEQFVLRQCDEHIKVLSSIFETAALFVPWAAIRVLDDLKKGIGQAILQKFGIQEGSIRDDVLAGHLKQIFEEIDVDKSGFIDRDEMASATSSMGITMSDKDLDALMTEFDVDGDKALSFEEFGCLIHSVLTKNKVKIMSKHRALAESMRPEPIQVDEGEVPKSAMLQQEFGVRSSLREKAVVPYESNRKYSHLQTPQHIRLRKQELKKLKG